MTQDREGTFDLDHRRDQLVRYVATAEHPWDATETVRLFEVAIHRKIAATLEALAAGILDPPEGNEYGHADIAAKAIRTGVDLIREP